MVFVTGALEAKPEAISKLSALGAGGGRCQKCREPFRLRVTLPDGWVGRAFPGLVVLAQRKESKPGPDPARFLDVAQPHGPAISPGAEKVDVDCRFADRHPVVECTGAAPASWG